MKIKNLYFIISILISGFVYGQTFQNSDLPFQKNGITVEKVVTGIIVFFCLLYIYNYW